MGYQSLGMELRHLRYFVAIADALNFRLAAERLSVSRPALSKQMKALEDEIGVRLLDRNTARVTLTAAGAIYLHEAREILARAEQAVERAQETAQGRRGSLAIGEPGPLGLPFLTQALGTFREEFPHVEVMLTELAPREQIAALAKGDLQVGFAFDRHLGDTREVESFTVLELRLGVAMGRGHARAGARGVWLRELAAERLLCLGDGRRSEHAATLRELLGEAKVDAGSVRGVGTFGSLLTMIASGHGMSLLPVELATYRPGDIVIVPINDPLPRLGAELKAIWRRGDESALVRNFVRTLRRFARRQAA